VVLDRTGYKSRKCIEALYNGKSPGFLGEQLGKGAGATQDRMRRNPTNLRVPANVGRRCLDRSPPLLGGPGSARLGAIGGC